MFSRFSMLDPSERLSSPLRLRGRNASFWPDRRPPSRWPLIPSPNSSVILGDFGRLSRAAARSRYRKEQGASAPLCYNPP
jgi:hypothetical protein